MGKWGFDEDAGRIRTNKRSLAQLESLVDFLRTRFLSKLASHGLPRRWAGLSGGGLSRSRCFYSEIGGLDAKIGLLREYFIAVGASKGLGSKLSDWNRVFLSPRIHRFFSSDAPKKKNYENYYPKEKKEIPKGSEQKSESKGDSNAGNNGNYQDLIKQLPNIVTPLILIAIFFMSFNFSPHEEVQISFQEFKNKLLEQGFVDHIWFLISQLLKCMLEIHHSIPDEPIVGPTPGTTTRGHGGHYNLQVLL
ncbi:hypothetical protein MLD38_017360 [Melastoma candidum]|uniref:Uncharacterized protein n=1 Tax=Melastoma candidum TaxID=119954 RepID=A0ACB9QQD7_9MYRT|nr:hypothetical protein MLD38_017360 [Melastoma candidum]